MKNLDIEEIRDRLYVFAKIFMGDKVRAKLIVDNVINELDEESESVKLDANLINKVRNACLSAINKYSTDDMISETDGYVQLNDMMKEYVLISDKTNHSFDEEYKKILVSVISKMSDKEREIIVRRYYFVQSDSIILNKIKEESDSTIIDKTVKNFIKKLNSEIRQSKTKLTRPYSLKENSRLIKHYIKECKSFAEFSVLNEYLSKQNIINCYLIELFSMYDEIDREFIADNDENQIFMMYDSNSKQINPFRDAEYREDNNLLVEGKASGKKKKIWFIVPAVIVVAATVCGFVFRTQIKEFYNDFNEEIKQDENIHVRSQANERLGVTFDYYCNKKTGEYDIKITKNYDVNIPYEIDNNRIMEKVFSQAQYMFMHIADRENMSYKRAVENIVKVYAVNQEDEEMGDIMKKTIFSEKRVEENPFLPNDLSKAPDEGTYYVISCQELKLIYVIAYLDGEWKVCKIYNDVDGEFDQKYYPEWNKKICIMINRPANEDESDVVHSVTYEEKEIGKVDEEESYDSYTALHDYEAVADNVFTTLDGNLRFAYKVNEDNKFDLVCTYASEDILKEKSFIVTLAEQSEFEDLSDIVILYCTVNEDKVKIEKSYVVSYYALMTVYTLLREESDFYSVDTSFDELFEVFDDYGMKLYDDVYCMLDKEEINKKITGDVYVEEGPETVYDEDYSDDAYPVSDGGDEIYPEDEEDEGNSVYDIMYKHMYDNDKEIASKKMAEIYSDERATILSNLGIYPTLTEKSLFAFVVSEGTEIEENNEKLKSFKVNLSDGSTIKNYSIYKSDEVVNYRYNEYKKDEKKEKNNLVEFVEDDGQYKVEIDSSKNYIYRQYKDFSSIIAYIGTDKNVVIPDKLGGKPVKYIEFKAFDSCSIESVTMPSELTEIGYMAFANCETMTKVTLNDKLKAICDSAFYYCINLKRINQPKSLLHLGYCAFEATFWEKIQEKDIKYFGNILYTVTDKDMKECKIKDGTYAIAEGAISNIDCYTIDIPDSVKYIASDVFKYLGNVKEIHIPDSVEYINYNTISNCDKLEYIKIPGKYFYEDFTENGMTDYIWSSYRTSDGVVAAVNECSSLKKVEISEGCKVLNSEIVSPTGDICTVEAVYLPKSIKMVNDKFVESFSDKTAFVADKNCAVKDIIEIMNRQFLINKK